MRAILSVMFPTAALLLPTPAWPAQGERNLEAALLYQLMSYAEWTVPVTSQLRLCTLGQDGASAALNKLHERGPFGRIIEVVEAGDLKDLKQCQIVYVSPEKAALAKRVAVIARKDHLLTISDQKGLGEMGMMINLLTESDKISFEINRGAADQAGIRFSSKLLRLAKSIIE